MIDYKLNETTIGHAKVIVDILPKGKVIPNAKITPTSITIHNTGNIGAPAKNNHNYMKNCNKNGDRIASWHFTVDDKEIWQAVPSNMKAWHAGNASGNNSSIGIEICMFNDAARQKKCYENAIELVKILMQHHGFNINQIKQHYDWTKKDCPTWLRSGKFGFNWSWFKNQIMGGAPISMAIDDGKVKGNDFIVKITVNELNIRKGPGTNYDVTGVLKKGDAYTIIETNGSWGKLKSGAGWINIHQKYVTRI
jgi:N-acetylmuramoyl-L-alanine amidase